MNPGAVFIIVVVILLFITFFGGWYIYLKTRNKERMALIEKDKDVSDIYAKRKINFGFPWLKVGIITTGFSIGWLVAVLVTILLRKEGGSYGMPIEPIVLGIIFLFTSISILVAYFVDKKNNKE